MWGSNLDMWLVSRMNNVNFFQSNNRREPVLFLDKTIFQQNGIACTFYVGNPSIWICFCVFWRPFTTGQKQLFAIFGISEMFNHSLMTMSSLDMDIKFHWQLEPGNWMCNEDQNISKYVQLKLVVSKSRGKNRKYSRSNYPKEVKEVKQNTLGNFLNPMNPNNKLVENCRNIFEEVNRNGFQYQKYIENWNFNIQYWSYSVSSKERAEQGWERISKTRSLACDCKYTEYMNGGDVLEWSIFLLRPFLGTKNHFLKSNIFNVRNKMLEVWITKNIMAMKWWTFLFTTIAKNYCRHLC